MRYVSGPQYIYVRDDLGPGEPTPWHTHRFPHNTFVLNGRARVELGYDPTGFDAAGMPVGFVRVEAREISSEDEIAWVLAPAQIWHRVTKLTERAKVACVFSHFHPETGEPIDVFRYENEAAYT